MTFRRFLLFAIATLCASPACLAALPLCQGQPADCTEVKLVVDGWERIYQYHLPQGSSCGRTNLPVVMHLHGGGGTAGEARNQAGYTSSDRNCFIYVFPQGFIFPGGGGGWNNGDCLRLPAQSGYTGPSTHPGCGLGLDTIGINDIHYFNALLDDLKNRVSYDARRVYASGWSHGGGMAHRLSCELADRITAIAPIEGTIKIAQCQASRAVPVMEWASLGDTGSPFTGGSGDTSVPYSIAVHLAVSQLPSYTWPTTTTVVPSPLSSAITDTVKQWLGGKNGSVVILHTLSSQLLHTWLNDNPPAFDWQEINWTFFKQYSIPAETIRRRSAHH